MIVRLAVVASLAGAAPLLAACGDGETDSDATEATTGDTADSAGTGPTDDVGSTEVDSGSDESDDASDTDSGSDESDGSSSIDGSGIDWATVDLTTIDWASIDMSTVDFVAIEENSTIDDLDADTVALIQQRYADEIAAGDGQTGSGQATLTIGDETWQFDGFVCAFGYENTESEVFTFSSNAFGTLDDGTRTQLQADIRDDTGAGALTGPDTEHEVTFDDIENFDDPAVKWVLNDSELTIDGAEISVEGTFRDLSTDEELPGSFMAECGPGSRF